LSSDARPTRQAPSPLPDTSASFSESVHTLQERSGRGGGTGRGWTGSGGEKGGRRAVRRWREEKRERRGRGKEIKGEEVRQREE